MDARHAFVIMGGGEAIMVGPLFERRLAALILDRDPFERTFRETLAGADDRPGLKLMNAVARRRARALLPMAEEWF